MRRTLRTPQRVPKRANAAEGPLSAACQANRHAPLAQIPLGLGDGVFSVVEDGRGQRRIRLPGDQAVVQVLEGSYTARWVKPATGETIRTDGVDSSGKGVRLRTPAHEADAALRIDRA